MSRVILVLIVLALAVGAGVALAADPGFASLQWLGWRVDTSAAAALLLLVGISVALAALWRLIGWLATAPARRAVARESARRRQALDLLAKGYLALAAGDAAEAGRQARKLGALKGQAPGLSHLLAAQAAEARGDDGAAQLEYASLLAEPEGRAAGQRGLRRLALQRGEAAGAAEPPPAEPDAPVPPLSLDR